MIPEDVFPTQGESKVSVGHGRTVGRHIHLSTVTKPGHLSSGANRSGRPKGSCLWSRHEFLFDLGLIRRAQGALVTEILETSFSRVSHKSGELVPSN